jgi:lipopolysaccharide/colanic/teichoic acid biosynthesis glycosyltransferase
VTGLSVPFLVARRRVERILVLGTTSIGEQVIREIENRPGHAVVLGMLDDRVSPRGSGDRQPVGDRSHFNAIIDQLRPDRIIVALADRRNRTPLMQALLTSAFARGITVENACDCYERLTRKLALEAWTPMSVVFSGQLRPSRLHQALARVMSLTAAIVALVALLPVLAIVALAIKLDSRGPILFAQERVGAHGRPFVLLKFRSMHHGGMRRSEWEGDNRDQVTRVGRWLRAHGLDELPQLLNILRGDMNLVGPRPHPVSNLELFTLVARNLNDLTGAAISCYALRTSVRPGLTGWAQVRYQYANNLEEEIEKLRYDLYYIKHLSIWLDLRILVETVKLICRHRIQRAPPAQHMPAESPRRAAAPTQLNAASPVAVVSATRGASPASVGRTREA